RRPDHAGVGLRDAVTVEAFCRPAPPLTRHGRPRTSVDVRDAGWTPPHGRSRGPDARSLWRMPCNQPGRFAERYRMNRRQSTTTSSRLGGTMLLVDDEEAMRRKTGILFKGAGCQVLSASNVNDTAVAIGTATPERALIEQRLPDGSGLFLLRELKQG